MPALDNPKHERFAQELSKGKSQAEAYAEAGYKPSIPHASRLASNGKVQARVAEIQERSVIRTVVTIESLIREAGEIQELAKSAGQYSAATAALTAKAKLAGQWVEKNENTNRNVADPATVSDADLAAVIAADSGAGTPAAPADPSKLN